MTSCDSLVHICRVCGSHSTAREEGRADPMPYLLLRGHWLATYGFVVDARVQMVATPNDIHLSVIETPQPMEPRVPMNFRRHLEERARNAAQQVHRQLREGA